MGILTHRPLDLSVRKRNRGTLQHLGNVVIVFGLNFKRRTENVQNPKYRCVNATLESEMTSCLSKT